MSSRHRIREDSAIAVVWALGMAIGIMFVFLTPGYVPELNSFLFGNLLTISGSDLMAFGIYTVVLMLFFALFYRRIVVCAFDPDFARVSRLPVRFINYSMTVLVAVCIVLTIRLVGVMLLMSMLALPQLIAEIYFRKFGAIMVMSAIVSVFASVAGLMTAAVVDVPGSAIIVLILVVVYLLLRIIKAFTR